MKKIFRVFIIVVSLLVVVSISILLGSSDKGTGPEAGGEYGYIISRVENLVSVSHSGKNFFITGGDGLIVEMDSSVDFVSRKADTLQDFLAISFSDDKNGWTVGTKGVVFKTNNGGRSWNTVNLDVGKRSDANLMSVDSDSSNRVVMGGENGTVIFSENGGKSFVDISIPDEMNISQVKLSKGKLLVGGEYASLYFYNHNRGVWKKIVANKFSGEEWMNPEIITGIVDIDDNKVGLVGLTGDIYIFNLKSGNVKAVASLKVPLYSVSRSADYFVASGDYGKLFYSKNFVNWEVASTDVIVNVFLRSVCFDGNFGVAVGGYGTVLTTKDGGVNWQKAS